MGRAKAQGLAVVVSPRLLFAMPNGRWIFDSDTNDAIPGVNNSCSNS